MEVTLEKGTPHGHKVTLPGSGDEYHDKAASDLVFTFLTLEHTRFTRQKDDLAVKVSLTLQEALLGFSKTILHLDGHEVTLSRQKVTQPGDVQQIRGEGMPVHSDPSSYGDLFVNYSVQFPSVLDTAQKALLAQLFRK